MAEARMKITFRPYRKRDNSLMLYINRSNGVSVGISADRGFAPYGRGATPGKRNAMTAALAVFNAYAVPFTGDLATHTEDGFCAVTPLADGWTLVGTDVCNIGGMQVGSDGMYIVRNNKILRCDTYDEPARSEAAE
jgi:hypothetical protein